MLAIFYFLSCNCDFYCIVSIIEMGQGYYELSNSKRNHLLWLNKDGRVNSIFPILFNFKGNS